MNHTVWPSGTVRNHRGELTIDGQSLTTLASTHGTPLYVFSESDIRASCRAYRDAFTAAWPNTRVVYAGKAGISGLLLKIISEEGLGLDVVSGGELAMALAAGVDPAEISFHGNNKGPQELREAVAAGVGKVIVDNQDEISRLAAIAAEASTRVSILLRLNPGVDVHTHRKISTGIADSKFGLPIRNGQAADAVAQILQHPRLDLLGYHAHIGSQLFEPDAYIAAIDEVMDFATIMQREHGIVMRHFSPGGGFGIAYIDEDHPRSAGYWAGIITSAVAEACDRNGLAHPVLTIEPGRVIAGSAGVAMYRIGSVKTIPGVRTYVAVDGGMADNIRPSLYDARYTAAIANRDTSGDTDRTVAIVGKYCESGDILIEEIALPEPAVGDLLAIPGCGAYCLPMASNYNGSLRPEVLLVNESGVQIMRRRETYQDLFQHDPVLAAASGLSPIG